MMKKFYSIKYIALPVLLLALAVACSTKRPTLVSRNYHALTAHYNVLFNGNEALEKGIQQLDRKTEEDFYREFPLEGIEFNDKVFLPGQSRSQDIQKAEEKAAKAVQKHSIYYRGQEYNGRMDEAFLLLGKGRYYDQRYLAALDAFNFALSNFYDTDLRDELYLWRGKTRLRMGQISLARKDLARVINNNQGKKSDTKALATAFLAESGRGDTLTRPVGELLSKAARQARSRYLRQRLAYKAAQVWEQLGEKDSAVAMTDLILKHRQPENFYLQTLWYRMHLTKEDTTLHEKYFKKLNTYLKNYYFHRYYPDIHYRLGELYEVRRDTANAIAHYSQSTRTQARTLKKLAYEHLADIYWDQSDYLAAGQYLDSLLSVMDKDKLDYLLVSQRRRSIDKIVKWESVIRRNDSLLKLAGLDTAEQRRLITEHIRRLQAEQARQAREQQEQTATTGQGTFYFYNRQQVAAGKEAFRKVWGKRKLEDLWRLTNKYGERTEEEETATGEQTEETATRTDSLPNEFNPEYYLKQIPRTQSQRDSIRRQTKLAHLYLGMHYADDKLKEYELARQHLRFVLDHQPDDEMRSRAWYLLYKIARKQHLDDEARDLAAKLQRNYPDSPYTQYILHPADFKGSSSRAFYDAFQQVYRTFREGRWDMALRLADTTYRRFRNHPEAAKVLMLKARILGKEKGIDAYMNQLKEIEKKYPDTEYAEQAKEMAKKLKLLKINYSEEYPEKFPFFVVFRVPRADSTSFRYLRQCLERVYRETESKPRDMFMDQFDSETSFIVIRNFLSRQSAEFILEKLKENGCSLPEHFIISRRNYIHLQLTKKRTDKSDTHVLEQRKQKDIRQRSRVQTTEPVRSNNQNTRRNPFPRRLPGGR